MDSELQITKEKIQQLEQRAEQLQKQGKFGESLDKLEEILSLKKNAYGEETEEYMNTCEKLSELCNLIAMICLQKDKYEACLDFLKKAEILSQNSETFKAITFNNMACYYRKLQKLRTALQYLQKALDIEIRQENPKTLADTHLNTCAVLSQLNKHQEALEHVLLSVVYLQDEFYQNLQDNQNKDLTNIQHSAQDIQDSNENQDTSQISQNQQNNTQKSENRLSVLAIAYHNMGVEMEYLKRYQEAIQAYYKAVNFAKKNLGPQHNLVGNLEQVLQTAQEEIEKKQAKQQKKSNKQSSRNLNQKMDQVQTLYKNKPDQNKKKYKSTNSRDGEVSYGTLGSDAINQNMNLKANDDDNNENDDN